MRALLLSCHSGIADLSLAAGMSVLADKDLVAAIPKLLSLDATATLVKTQSWRDVEARIEVESSLPGEMSYTQVQESLLQAARLFPETVTSNVVDDALSVLYLRQTVHARTLGIGPGDRAFPAPQAALLLVELLATTLLYHQLGRPEVFTVGSLMVGGMSAPEVLQMLARIPQTMGPSYLELTSPTSAALLASWHTRHLTAAEAARLSFEDTVVIPTHASDDHRLTPSELSLVDFF